jgi:arylsulfatase A-like enzyme
MPFRSEISRRRVLKLLGGGALAAAGAGPGLRLRALRGADSRTRKPNVVLLLIDDLGWKDAGFMGSRYYETPHVDRLAREGMTFTSAYANAPNCAPTRACLLSGQYGPRHGVYTVGSSARGRAEHRKLIPIRNNPVLPPKTVTIAEALQRAGYVCGHVGKWHLGADPGSGPRAQGFDVNVAGNRAGSPRGYFSPYRNRDLPDGPRGEYLTDRLTAEAVRFIEQNRARPFFLYLCHYAVHTPLQAKPKLVEKYRPKPPDGGHRNPTYAAMIDSVDQGVGRILAKLDELKLADDTVVIFFSDNGGYGPATSMAPLRGAKGMLYEGGIREPMIVRWPGKVRAGSRCDVPVIGLDFYPTMLALAGAEADPQHVLDGESLVPLLRGTGSPKRDAIFWHFPAYLQAYRGGEGPWRTTPAGAVRAGDWKLIEFFEDGRLELYNLKDDIGEKRNLADKLPDRTRALHRRLAAWRRRVGAPVPTKRNPKYDPNAKFAPRGRRATRAPRTVRPGGL